MRDQVSSGRYGTESDVIRDGLRMLEDREQRRARMNAAIERGLAAMEAGRVVDAEEVFARLEAKYMRMAKERGEA